MYKVLKPNLMKTNTSQFGRSSQLNTSIINQSTVDGNKLKEIFKQIESKDHELLTFFRSFDYQSNWFVDFKI